MLQLQNISEDKGCCWTWSSPAQRGSLRDPAVASVGHISTLQAGIWEWQLPVWWLHPSLVVLEPGVKRDDVCVGVGGPWAAVSGPLVRRSLPGLSPPASPPPSKPHGWETSKWGELPTTGQGYFRAARPRERKIAQTLQCSPLVCPSPGTPLLLQAVLLPQGSCSEWTSSV